jgi:hypothetical protein
MEKLFSVGSETEAVWMFVMILQGEEMKMRVNSHRVPR